MVGITLSVEFRSKQRAQMQLHRIKASWPRKKEQFWPLKQKYPIKLLEQRAKPKCKIGLKSISNKLVSWNLFVVPNNRALYLWHSLQTFAFMSLHLQTGTVEFLLSQCKRIVCLKIHVRNVGKRVKLILP